jgi:cytochrome c553
MFQTRFHHALILFFIAAWFTLPEPAASGQTPAKAIDFDRDIRPIFADKCFACHGPDAKNQESEFRLDTQKQAFANLGGYQVIEPGKAGESELVRRIMSTDADEVMPPADYFKSLTDAQKQKIADWIDSGAKWSQPWAFVPPVAHEPPQVTQSGWTRNWIDQFILHRLESQQIKPSPVAKPHDLLRRLTFDLNGLPPTAAQREAFMDKPDAAYEAMVDELLASERFGERMAVYWLDLVRYADSVGYHGDQSVSVSPYRDYVIKAFNQNMPFDQFTLEQLAGDLLENPSLEQQVASGYNRLGMMSAEGGVQPEEYLAKYAADRVRNTASIWLGVTLGCAECHDHKFDPLSTKDFYRFASFFADIQERGLYGGDDWGPKIEVADPGLAELLAPIDQQLSELQSQIRDTPEIIAARDTWETNLAKRQTQWSLLKPASFAATNKVEAKFLPDESLLISGANPVSNVYVVTVDLAAENVSGFRLESIPDKSLPAKGAGRAGNGNFVVTEWTVLRGDHSSELETLGKTVNHWPKELLDQKLTLNNPTATIEQALGGEKHPDKRWSAASAIDGDTRGESWGWAILPDATLTNELVVHCEPQSIQGKLTFVIHQNHQNGAHTLGRFRLAVTDAADATTDPQRALPQEVQAALAVARSDRNEQQAKTIADYYRSIAPALTEVRQKIESLNKQREALRKEHTRTTLVTVSVEPRTMRVLKRGNWMDKSGEVVTPGVPAYFSQIAAETRATRLDLAKWITDPQNPLTARVLVNRLWKLFHGNGLSNVLDDLGAQGEPPSHPELLDNLALELINSGWDIKHVIKLMVMSQTYRQSSQPRGELKSIDPYNRLYARQASFRLDAEFVRDNVLATSGLLKQTVGGRSVKPYQPDGLYRHLNFPVRTYTADTGDDQYRRGVYTHWQRQFLHPAMKTLDAPSREECTAKRPRSNTPLAALLLLNDPSYVEAAKVLAADLVANQADNDLRIRKLFQRALTRDPRPDEVQVVNQLMVEHLKYFGEQPQAAQALLDIGETKVEIKDNLAQLAAWTSVCRAVLNMHEFVTRN